MKVKYCNILKITHCVLAAKKFYVKVSQDTAFSPLTQGCVASHLGSARGPQAMQIKGNTKSSGRKEQEDKKGDERRYNGKKLQRGGKKKELSTSRLLEIMKGEKDEGGKEHEDISKRGQRKKK